MSQENVEIVRGMYDAFGRGDGDAALAYFDPGVVVDASHRVDGRVGHGHQELVAILGEWMGTWKEWRGEGEGMGGAGGRGVGVRTQRGRGKGRGGGGGKRLRMVFGD